MIMSLLCISCIVSIITMRIPIKIDQIGTRAIGIEQTEPHLQAFGDLEYRNIK